VLCTKERASHAPRVELQGHHFRCYALAPKCVAVAGVAVLVPDMLPVPESAVTIQDSDTDKQYEGISLLQFMSTLSAQVHSSSDEAPPNILTVHCDPPASLAGPANSARNCQPDVRTAGHGPSLEGEASAQPSPASATASADVARENVQNSKALKASACLPMEHGARSHMAPARRNSSWGVLPRGQFASVPDVELRPGTALVASGSGHRCCDTGIAAAASVTEVSLADMAPKLFAAHADTVVRLETCLGTA
jgi:hypothetical protein